MTSQTTDTIWQIDWGVRGGGVENIEINIVGEISKRNATLCRGTILISLNGGSFTRSMIMDINESVHGTAVITLCNVALNLQNVFIA